MAHKNSEITELEFVFLREFYSEGHDLTIKILQKRTRYSYERAYSYLKSLAEKGAITKKTVGKTIVYSLNFKKMSAKIAYWLYSTKKANEFSSKKEDIFIGISELPEQDLELYSIFGSYAKGNERKERNTRKEVRARLHEAPSRSLRHEASKPHRQIRRSPPGASQARQAFCN